MHARTGLSFGQGTNAPHLFVVWRQTIASTSGSIQPVWRTHLPIQPFLLISWAIVSISVRSFQFLLAVNQNNARALQYNHSVQYRKQSFQSLLVSASIKTVQAHTNGITSVTIGSNPSNTTRNQGVLPALIFMPGGGHQYVCMYVYMYIYIYIYIYIH